MWEPYLRPGCNPAVSKAVPWEDKDVEKGCTSRHESVPMAASYPALQSGTGQVGLIPLLWVLLTE